ncbi:hypothetical protein KIN20_035227 [Parelaphostrongylus tenuis]|uniref:Uncharacterized protein n=1 Tax=Parelaphostrongylus tenuis TaxID=148309 RepID=A0AAD5RB97_PARTN|nr:hypothetical protein KIN20_035227 [Parelaphostrongylus tenuis]
MSRRLLARRLASSTSASFAIKSIYTRMFNTLIWANQASNSCEVGDLLRDLLKKVENTGLLGHDKSLRKTKVLRITSARLQIELIRDSFV